MNGPWNQSGGGRFERVLVYGLGLSGRAAARLLVAQGATVLAMDDKAVDAGDLAGRIELLPARELPAGVDLVVVSPGVPLNRPILEEARRRGVPVIAEVELAYPFLDGPVLAITGSNGKSTTTAMAGAMVRAAGLPVEVCGNIGEPLADKVEGSASGGAGRIFVVELSSFQIEGIVTLKPKAAALLNLAEDHLDRYGSMAAYAEAKRRLFRDMDEGDVAVFNADDPETLRTPTRARRRLFSRRRWVEDGCFATADSRVIEVAPGAPEVELFHASDVQLAGVQNLENAMAAALLARAVGVEPAAIAAALRGFTGLPHRLEKVGEHNGVTFYDDSKGTNPAATLKSIEGFADGTVHLLLGGRNKGADLSVLVPLVQRKARRAYLIGESAGDFERVLGGTVPHETPGTMDRAVTSAARQARPGDVVVLSPACASFDQFRNFMHRGQVFKELVRNVLHQLGGPHGEEARL